MPAVQEASRNAFLQSLSEANTNKRSEAEQAQDRFLTLLVTQMKNQDPLNPLDNAQVTTQLAQISTVTGLDTLNTTLQGLSDSFASSQMLQAATLIGRDVLVPGKQINLQQGAARFGVDLAQPADQVVVTVLDATGNVVRTQDLGAHPSGTISFAWNGVNDQGATMSDGPYQISVVAKQAGQIIAAAPLTYARVESVAHNDQNIELELAGIGAVTLRDVRRFN